MAHVIEIRFKDGDFGYYVDDFDDSIHFTGDPYDAMKVGFLEGDRIARQLEEEYSSIVSSVRVVDL